jgi:hypothetical protein
MEFQMRNKTFISSMVGVAAAVAVAGSANAGVVIDAFTNSSVGRSASTAITGLLSPFNSRTFEYDSNKPVISTVTNRLVLSSDGGDQTVTWRSLSGTGAPYTLVTGADLSSLASVTFDVSGLTSNVSITFALRSQSGTTDNFSTTGAVTWSSVAINANPGTQSVTLNLGQNSGGTYSTSGTGTSALSNVNCIYMSFGSSFTGQIGNIQYNNVPAPGALALLGAAGLVGARRRR